MFQDIKNFLQVMDIDTSNKLNVVIELKQEIESNFQFSVNNLPCSIGRNKFTFDLFDNLYFTCKKEDFIGFEIVEITINNYKIFPLYMHKAEPPTNWLDKPCEWNFNIQAPFYLWYHNISGNGWIA